MHIRSSLPFALLVLLACMKYPTAALSQPPRTLAPDSALAAALMQDLQQVARLPGLSVAAWSNGRVRFAQGVGYRDVERRMPVDSSIRFGSASVSKVVTATAALRMLQDGRFDVDEPISRHFPGFPGAAAITPRALAAHLSGIPHYGPGSTPSDRRHVWARDALHEFALAPRVGAPGEQSAYSTHGITLLSAVMEQRSEMPILALLKREVFEPFDMPSSGGLFVDSVSIDAARFYERNRDSLRPLSRPRNLSYAWAGAGLLQTPVDLVRMTRPYFDGTFTSATLSTAFTEQFRADGTPTGVAFVWRVEHDWRGRPVAHHAGVNPGARSVVLMRRHEGRSVAVMTNVEWTASMDRTANMFAEALFDSAPGRRPMRVTGTWVGSLDSAVVQGEWAIAGETGWVSTPAKLRVRFASAGGVASDRLPLRAIRDDLYALVTPWGLYPLDITRDASGAVTARVQVGAHRWELRAR